MHEWSETFLILSWSGNIMLPSSSNMLPTPESTLKQLLRTHSEHMYIISHHFGGLTSSEKQLNFLFSQDQVLSMNSTLAKIVRTRLDTRLILSIRT
jgi:hypothetical protein